MRQFTAAERLAACGMARQDLYFYSRWMFMQQRGFAWLRGQHHRIICDALMRVFRGETKRLIINVPPRYSKTELAVVNFIPWALGQYPDAEFIHTSYSANLSIGNAYRAREQVRHEAYAEIFPDVLIKADANAKNDWKTTAGGTVYATGVGGTITGYGAGKLRAGFGGAIIIDDPHKADEAKSDPIRQGVIEWFQNTLESRKNTPDTPIILIMQRLHEQDLAGWLIGGGNGEDWEVVSLPAITGSGDALWPEKHNIKDLDRLRRTNSYVFSGQYLQQPTPPGGEIIKGAWFPRYSVVPPLRWRAAYVDTAQKAGQHNDYTVFTHAGMGVDGRIYILDVRRQKVDAVGLEKLARDLYASWRVTSTVTPVALRYFAIEDKSSGTGLIQQLKGRHRIPVKPIKRLPGQDKYSRVMDVQGHLESGFACLPDNAPWVADFIAECEAFTATDAHAHDDQVDTLADCINDMLGGSISMLDLL